MLFCLSISWHSLYLRAAVDNTNLLQNSSSSFSNCSFYSIRNTELTLSHSSWQASLIPSYFVISSVWSQPLLSSPSTLFAFLMLHSCFFKWIIYCFFKMSCSFLSFFKIHLFTCAYIVWAISPNYPPTPFFSPHPPSLPLPLFLILLKRRHKQ
jgi:hypothetical protein